MEKYIIEENSVSNMITHVDKEYLDEIVSPYFRANNMEILSSLYEENTEHHKFPCLYWCTVSHFRDRYDDTPTIPKLEVFSVFAQQELSQGLYSSIHQCTEVKLERLTESERKNLLVKDTDFFDTLVDPTKFPRHTFSQPYVKWYNRNRDYLMFN